MHQFCSRDNGQGQTALCLVSPRIPLAASIDWFVFLPLFFILFIYLLIFLFLLWLVEDMPVLSIVTGGEVL